MKFFVLANLFIALYSPAFSVTTKMFKVLDTCARYRLNEINAYEAIEKLKLKEPKNDQIDINDIVRDYCSVFTPNEKIEF